MRAIVLAFGLLWACALNALAAERITSFVSDVAIAADSSLTVRETIDLVSEGREIRRGILRDFPTTYTDRKGLRYVVGFDVLGVRRDGRDEPYSIESISNGKRIRIGSGDVLLDDGPHGYEITYRTTRQLAYFADFDELYWNVTGLDWTFPIERAEAMIHLPPGATVLHHDAYTGADGARGKDFTVLSAGGDLYRAETTRPLSPGEGFTVAVGWPKGFVTVPTKADEHTILPAGQSRRDHRRTGSRSHVSLLSLCLVAGRPRSARRVRSSRCSRRPRPRARRHALCLDARVRR